MKQIKIVGALAVFLSLSFVVAAPLYAATYQAGEHYTLPSDQRVPGNLYAIGSDIQLLGNVAGDAYVAGGKILITGPVLGDVAAGAGTVDILSPVSGDVRVAGGSVTIGNVINGDVVVFGGKVHILAGSVVRGDVLLFGGELSLNGAVQGNIRGSGKAVSLEGPVTGNVDIQAGEKMNFATTATIGGYLHYTSPTSLTLRDGAVRGEVKYNQPKDTTKGVGAAAFALLFGIVFAIKLAGLIIGTLVVSLAMPRYTHAVVKDAIVHFGSSLLLGFAVLVATPVLAVLLAITIIGIIPALIIFLSYILCVIAAAIYAGILVGGFLSNWWKQEIRTDWKWALLGTVIIVIIGLLPILGEIAAFVFFLAALGSLVRAWHKVWKERNATMVSAEVV